MKHMKYPLLFAATLLLASCDKVEDPLGNDDGPVVDPGATAPRKVLLEDCTGMTCNNCPQAAEIAEELKGIYGDQLIVVAVHMVDGFAAPVPPLNDGLFDTDFRTPAGAAYEQAFNITSLPKGLVSRAPFENAVALSRTKWSSAVAAIIGHEADFKLWFDALDFNAGTNTVNVTVKALCTKAITGDHNLTIYLTEDSVIDDQLNLEADPPTVEDYVHRHVLRDNLNGTWGEPLLTGSANAGDTLSLSYTYTLSANVLDPANCALVAYVHPTTGTDARVVKQVEEAKLIP
jgi:hypothetical protein